MTSLLPWVAKVAIGCHATTLVNTRLRAPYTVRTVLIYYVHISLEMLA